MKSTNFSFDRSYVRSNINLNNVTKNIVKSTKPNGRRVINGFKNPFKIISPNSLNKTTRNIVNLTSPLYKKDEVTQVKDTYTPINYNKTINQPVFDFVNMYNKPISSTSSSSSQDIINNTTNITRNEIIKQEIINNTIDMPCGSIMQYISNVAPNGWLICDGKELLISQYKNLYNIIGNTYGETSDSKYFKLPDFRGRVSVGAGTGNGLSTRNLGELGGEEKHKLTISEMPIHNHNGTTLNGGNHTHNVNDPGHHHIVNTVQKNGNNTVPNTFNKNDTTRIDNKQLKSSSTNKETTNISIGPNGDHTHEFTTNNCGGGLEHNNMQPYLVTYYIIKA
jgi:microcystin-dependent protein